MPPLEREVILDNGMAFSRSSILAIIVQKLVVYCCADILCICVFVLKYLTHAVMDNVTRF
jgi:hypothetical protein